jgi:hypothetical protein
MSKLEQCATLPVRSKHRAVIIHGAVASAQDMPRKLPWQFSASGSCAQYCAHPKAERGHSRIGLTGGAKAADRNGKAAWQREMPRKVAAHGKRNQTTAAGRNRAGSTTDATRRFLHAQQSSNGNSDGKQTNFGNEECLAHLEEHLTLEMRCACA